MNLLLVTARDENGEIVICAVDPDADGVHSREYRVVDGQRMADVIFTDVTVSEDQLLVYDSVERALDEVMTYGDSVLCGEPSGSWKR